MPTTIITANVGFWAWGAHRQSLRSEHARAADNLRAELSAEAAQHFQHLEQQQSVFAQARLRTVESALGTEYASAQQNLQQQYLTQVQGLHNELQTAQRHFYDQLAQERAAKGQELEAPKRELAEKAQIIREQVHDLQENARMHREMHANEEARAHETLAMQASQWQTHCGQVTQQYDAEMAECAEKVSKMERDLDELSAKYIEASEKQQKLEQWDTWWRKRDLRTPERQKQLTGTRKGLRQLQRRNGDSSQLLHLYSLSLVFRKNFCLRLFRQSSLTKISREGRMRATNPAIPVWIHKPYRLLLQLLRRVRTNIHHQL